MAGRRYAHQTLRPLGAMTGGGAKHFAFSNM
jgi:hypothetical protein